MLLSESMSKEKAIRYIVECEKAYVNRVKGRVCGQFGDQQLGRIGYDGQPHADEIMIVEPEITIMYDYPLSQKTLRKHTREGGWTRRALVERIQTDYVHIYAEEAATMKGEPCYIEQSMNRARSNGMHGIWGHVLPDLILHTLYTHGNGPERVYSLGIDS